MKILSRQEEILLLAIWRLRDNAYGVTIREYVSKITGKYWSIGSIYVPLDRLEKRGLVKASPGEPEPKRRGRRKRMFTLSPNGMKALGRVKKIQEKLWEGFPEFRID